ncbi:sialate O-acetylesterase [uncultured Muribaculum sp.]|jgi:sialate O-acetylesterase|uniref:sialate O-acetylesterase n=3 Tax=Muribaculum TaxID=1918540 RepID=UPI0025AEE2A0|nr:sialate O-acetylesterase [uncultured Muribaculum sp.]
MKLRYLLAALSVAFAFGMNALTLPRIIGDNMMLQQKSNVLLWGWAKPGSKVKVVTDWNGKSYSVQAAGSGRWDIRVATPEASYETTSFTIEGDGKKIKVRNVLVGEVWFASGQSNMEMPMQGFIGSPVDGSNEAIAASGKLKHALRFSTTPRQLSAVPLDSVGGPWVECTPENAAEFSAIGFYFARRLNEMLDVPVGIINCSYGGTRVEGWMPGEILKQYPEIDLTLAAKPGVMEAFQPMSMYNGMLYPLAGYTVRGFLWNQGESNVGMHDTYHKRLAQMVEHWRKLWDDNSLPFYAVEIPPFCYGDGLDGVSAALLRESQQKSIKLIPNSGMVSSIDLYTPGLWCQIHPSVKQPAADRLAYMAAGRTYGIQGIQYQSPSYKSMEKIDNGAAVMVRFNDAVEGMNPYQGMKGFEVAGEDRKFYPANAEQIFGPYPVVEGVKLSCPEVKNIVAIRYCFKNWPEVGNVYNLRQLPLMPFRTDNW